MKKIIDYDPWSGMTTTFEYDELTDQTYVGSEQDCGALLELTAALRNNEQYSRDGMKDSWWHYAIIPPIIIEKWLKEDGVNVFNRDHEKAVFRKLNSPEYKYLKTTAKMHMG